MEKLAPSAPRRAFKTCLHPGQPTTRRVSEKINRRIFVVTGDVPTRTYIQYVHVCPCVCVAVGMDRYHSTLTYVLCYLCGSSMCMPYVDELTCMY